MYYQSNMYILHPIYMYYKSYMYILFHLLSLSFHILSRHATFIYVF